MKCLKIKKLTITDEDCKVCQKKCSLATNSRYNVPGNYARKRIGTYIERQIKGSQLANMNNYLDKPEGNYYNTSPSFVKKEKVPIGLGDILHGKEPVFE